MQYMYLQTHMTYIYILIRYITYPLCHIVFGRAFTNCSGPLAHGNSAVLDVFSVSSWSSMS